MSRLLILSLTLATVVAAPAFAASPSPSGMQTTTPNPQILPPELTSASTDNLGRALNPQPLPP
ncbi:hypothetical protein TSH100_02600 [Azospirillum sp. TSH100]|uniref:hypothetical protein n=1 Tax=Azospirillum sp. TSH100 TaxID=652764 RepID=UPI000D608F2A|nr:hypothetical protein [Azospirillum sp. TSH100]PWC90917.1 hypothetical protein TSH100_02600 [Azospirillum sp. TSH100]QCG90714.1 hypothetical protein E6C72_23300 [Azospirillum sp. TSH100]